MRIRRIVITLAVCVAFSTCLFGCKKKAEVEPVSSEIVLASESEKIVSSEEELSEDTSDFSSTEDKSEQKSEKEHSEEVSEQPQESAELMEGGLLKEWDGIKTPDGLPAVERDGEPIYIDIVNTYWKDEFFGHPDADTSAHVDEFLTLAQEIENNPDYDCLIYSNCLKGGHIIFTGEHKGYLCFLLKGCSGYCLDKSSNRIYECVKVFL